MYLQEDSRGTCATGCNVDNGTEKLKLDFSGIVSHLKAEPAVAMEVPDAPEPSVQTPSLRKRKRVDYTRMETGDDVAEITDLGFGLESTVSDHDYVTKKPKLALVKFENSAAVDVTSTVTVDPVASEVAVKSEPVTKYRERRDKNNEASRRSRQIRKQKYIEMDKEAQELEVKNEALRKKIIELEALAKTMKATLIKKMTDK